MGWFSVTDQKNTWRSTPLEARTSPEGLNASATTRLVWAVHFDLTMGSSEAASRTCTSRAASPTARCFPSGDTARDATAARILSAAVEEVSMAPAEDTETRCTLPSSPPTKMTASVGDAATARPSHGAGMTPSSAPEAVEKDLTNLDVATTATSGQAGTSVTARGRAPTVALPENSGPATEPKRRVSSYAPVTNLSAEAATQLTRLPWAAPVALTATKPSLPSPRLQRLASPAASPVTKDAPAAASDVTAPAGPVTTALGSAAVGSMTLIAPERETEMMVSAVGQTRPFCMSGMAFPSVTTLAWVSAPSAPTVQTLTVLSAEEVARDAPSGLQTALYTLPLWAAAALKSTAPVAASRTITALSAEAVTRNLPSGLKATALTNPVCSVHAAASLAGFSV
mmetsp:Transcript_16835/g.63842  ORF Transcript_16835/g.63842 Transcript_16835/m.63842 type:complete len:398 (+) Transcript_16835:228-1421(+)